MVFYREYEGAQKEMCEAIRIKGTKIPPQAYLAAGPQPKGTIFHCRVGTYCPLLPAHAKLETFTWLTHITSVLKHNNSNYQWLKFLGN